MLLLHARVRAAPIDADRRCSQKEISKDVAAAAADEELDYENVEKLEVRL
jgi:hypothetical protein